MAFILYPSHSFIMSNLSIVRGKLNPAIGNGLNFQEYTPQCFFFLLPYCHQHHPGGCFHDVTKHSYLFILICVLSELPKFVLWNFECRVSCCWFDPFWPMAEGWPPQGLAYTICSLQVSIKCYFWMLQIKVTSHFRSAPVTGNQWNAKRSCHMIGHAIDMNLVGVSI